MVEVKFYDEIDDKLLKFAVIITKTNNQLVFCKHQKRDTYEIPGGHRENGETIFDTARRELYEETGALIYDIKPICVYSVVSSCNIETFGMLYLANVSSFEKELHNEIEKIIITDKLIENWTYPLIQPKLIEEAKRRGYL
ncbi:MAG: NUDIX domain-containing protein [Bacilli bacterium]|nr:NUDIX domain-containing protein [Bacilli bacterium]